MGTYSLKPKKEKWHADVNALDHLPRERVLVALGRLKAAIERGLPLQAYDDTTPGDKSTSCSWGLCTESAAIWPDAEDHIWPLDFESEGRVAPLRPEKASCPMDQLDRGESWGCFYSCRVFQASRKNPAPDRQKTLDLYTKKIEELS